MHFNLSLLILATILFALGPSLLKSLMNIATGLGLGASALSYCNVLFVGNLCAGLVVLLSGPRRIIRELATLPRRTKLELLAAAVISTIYPALLYTALERTSVLNIVLLSRFNGIVYVVAAGLVLRTRVSRPEIAGYATIGVGVIVMVLANNMGPHVGAGDAFVLLATVFFAMTELISKRVLRHASIASYVFFRNFVGAILFFVVGTYFFGLEHFAEAFSGDLWILMVAYAGVAVVVAQAAWLGAVKRLPVRTVVNSQLLNPLFSIAFAFLLLGEVPNRMQWLVIGIVFVGMLIPRISGHQWVRRDVATSIDTSLVGR